MAAHWFNAIVAFAPHFTHRGENKESALYQVCLNPGLAILDWQQLFAKDFPYHVCDPFELATPEMDLRLLQMKNILCH